MRNQPAVGLQPGEKALDLPSPLVTTQLATVLRPWLGTIPAVWRYQLNPQLPTCLIQRVAVIGLVTNELAWLARGETRRYQGADKGRLVRCSTCCA